VCGGGRWCVKAVAGVRRQFLVDKGGCWWRRSLVFEGGYCYVEAVAGM